MPQIKEPITLNDTHSLFPDQSMPMQRPPKQDASLLLAFGVIMLIIACAAALIISICIGDMP